jgi:hypothetical protein
VVSELGRVGAHLGAGVTAQQPVDLGEAADDAPAAGALYEPADRLDLGAHRPGRELVRAEPGGRRARDGALTRRAVVVIDGGHVRGQHKRLRGQVDGQQRRREVLVNHRLNPQLVTVVVLHDWDPAPTGADHQVAGVEEDLDRAQLHDPPRPG